MRRDIVRFPAMHVDVVPDSPDVLVFAKADRHNLRADPSGLDRIEAARRLAPLRNFLASVNATESPFETLACKAWSAALNEAADPQVFASRVDLIFLREDINFGRGPHQDLARRLAELLERDGGNASRVELHVAAAKFAVGNKGFCLRLFVYAGGATAEQASARCGLGLARVQQALLFVARGLRQKAADGNGD